MGLLSLFEPSNSECQCPTAVRNDPNRSYKERRSFRDRVEMVTEILEKLPTKIPIIVERFRRVSDDIICFFNLLLIQQKKLIKSDVIQIWTQTGYVLQYNLEKTYPISTNFADQNSRIRHLMYLQYFRISLCPTSIRCGILSRRT